MPERKASRGWEGLRRVLRWPSTPTGHYAPWYVIAWRLLFYPVLLVGLCLCVFAVACGYGPRAARSFWIDAT